MQLSVLIEQQHILNFLNKFLSASFSKIDFFTPLDLSEKNRILKMKGLRGGN